jgi:threonine/homoserine/homoserine lactone efflux protein
MVSMLNPKTALFFMAFLPQFVDSARGNVARSKRFAQGQRLFAGTVFIGLGVSATLTGAPAGDGFARGLP